MTYQPIDPRQRVIALAGVGVVQLLVLVALWLGGNPDVVTTPPPVDQLIDVESPPPPPRRPEVRAAVRHHLSPAPRGGGAQPAQQPIPPASPPTPLARVAATQPAGPAIASGGVGSGAGIGAGAGSGNGAGDGSGAGGADLELLSGDITPRDYPKDLGNRGISGRVSVRFVVEPNGRADRCRLIRSSGIAELDDLTCQLIEARFRFRPTTDRFGRPIPDEVDYDQDWDASR